MNETVLVGDLGGQWGTTHSVLKRLGVGDDLRLPQGLCVVQVGDIIRFSPHLRQQNTWVASTILGLIRANPGRWIQLAGNHECAALSGPARPHWNRRECFTDECLDILGQLWTGGDMRIAASAHRSDGGSPVLITHAGLTAQRWEDLNRPDAAEAASRLNEWSGRPFDVFSEPGVLVTGAANHSADPLWAEANVELYPPWIARGQMPFHQIHGHSGPFHWGTDQWNSDCTADIRDRTDRDDQTRRTSTRVGTAGPCFHGIDWMLGDEPTSASWPLPRSPISRPAAQ